MTIAVCRALPDLRSQVSGWRRQGRRVALVPTMGALHAGHLALVKAARRPGDRTIVSIFVNPSQFAPGEDFAAYPRSFEADCEKLEAAEADLVYAPEVATVYPQGFATTVTVGGPALAGLEDRFRPTHFVGVATVVAKLLAQAQPDLAFFGEKDFQQLRVIERMVRDLDMPVAVHGVPIVREADGLALSSRNVYLDARQREIAPILHRELMGCARAIREGSTISHAEKTARTTLAAAGFEVDYVEVRHAATLDPLTAETAAARVLAAARLGVTRLIDNVAVGVAPTPRRVERPA